MSGDITIFDDLLSFDDRLKAYQFMKSSFFKIGWNDSITEEHAKYSYLHSNYSDDDLTNLGIYSKIMESDAGKLVAGMTKTKAIVNLSLPSDVNFIHSHPEKKVILYYVNVNWEEGWHGETLFFNESRKKIEFASPYTPGRIIVFDAKIPHTIRPQSHIASNYRFTFSIFFE